VHQFDDFDIQLLSQSGIFFRIFGFKFIFMAKSKKRPKDTNQLAKYIVELATGEAVEQEPEKGKNPHAVALGRSGGLKGGKARASKLTAERRKEIAKKAAEKRWKKKED
jgi:hypothetical protein